MWEPSASRNTGQPCGLDGMATTHIIEVKSEPIQAKQVAETQTKQSDTTSRSSPLESERVHYIQVSSDSKSCWDGPLTPYEESKESCVTLSDDNEPDFKSPLSPPSESIQLDIDDPWAIVAHLLEEHHHVNPDAGLQSCALDNTMGYL